MKSIVSLGMAATLIASPFADLGVTVASAAELRNAKDTQEVVENQSNQVSELQSEQLTQTEYTEEIQTPEQSEETEVPEQSDEIDETEVQEQSEESEETEVLEQPEQPEEPEEAVKSEVLEKVGESELEALETPATESVTSEVEETLTIDKKENQQLSGTLEFETYFPTPVTNLKDFSLALQKDGQTLGDIDLAKETGTVGEYTYTIEKYDSKRQPIEVANENIYFVRVVIEKLEVGQYSAQMTGAGYQPVSISTINLSQYSKRVKFATAAVDENTQANMSTEYPQAFLVGDVNEDGQVTEADYKLVEQNLGSSESKYDLNRDGSVDVTDLTYIYGNQGVIAQAINIENTNPILDTNEVAMNNDKVTVENGKSLSDLLSNDASTVNLSKPGGQAPSESDPLSIDMAFGQGDDQPVLMEQVVIKVPTIQPATDSEAGVPEKGYVTYTDANGVEKSIPFDNSMARSNGDIVIDLGAQVAVKKISINVTGNRGNKQISQIAKVEFLNNVYTELPKPDMNIPTIKTLETSTNLHDERITISWDAQPNVTSYEVTYEQLDEKTGAVTKTKKLQTNEPSINILDKDIKPYSLYRVKVQSLNGDWQSGYLTETDVPSAFDGKADNVDANYNPIQDYYNGNIGSVTEVQVIPISSPDKPINLVTTPGYKSFTVTWETHIQARDFDIYYRKVGEQNWIKANQDKIEVTETSPEVTNPDPNYLVRAGSYTVSDLENDTTYEVRVTATNHLGTSQMSDTYLASTEMVTPPVMTGYNLINRPTDANEIGTDHIISVVNKSDSAEDGGWGADSALTYDSKYALVDGDFGTSWKVQDWDTGAVYGSNRGSIITFDQVYNIGTLAFAKSLEQGYQGSYTNKVKITYWDEADVQHVVTDTLVESKISNSHKYYVVTLNEPINAKKIKVDTAGGGAQSISELKFYQYDSLEDEVAALFEDTLRVKLNQNVTQEIITELVTRANTPDPVSGDYHPKQETILKELQLAQDLLNDANISQKLVQLDASIRDNGAALGMNNAWQALGAVARPSTDANNQAKTISVYMGSSDPNTQVEIAFLQVYGQPGAYISKSVIIKPGRTEIAIPEIMNADVEKGGVVMAKVRSGSTDANIQIRLSNVDEIPHLNVNNLINDESKESEVKDLINTYIDELEAYVKELPSKYPSTVTSTDKLNNIYLYDEQTSVLNSTDIEGDRFTLTVPATQVLKGIQSGLTTREEQVNRLYNALLAWEQELLVVYAKKGVFLSVQDFDGNGTIDSTDTAYYNKHKAPTTRLNIKYQRMIMGAAAYASSHHVGIGFGTVLGLMQGVPYLINEQGEVTNPQEAHFYGALIGHEIGHVVDIANRLYPETSNNLLADLTHTMLDEDAPKVTSGLTELYKKVTSNTYGLSTNRLVVLGMLWQPHLAYDDESTYKMLLTNFDGDLSDDTYFAKLNRAYREMTAEEKADGDRDQWLIRLSSKVVGKDLSDFYLAHGIVPNATTLNYVSQFPKEDRPIQYINDEARRRRLANDANMQEGTTLTASFGVDKEGQQIQERSYLNQSYVPFTFTTTDQDHILGYEIIRNGKPSAFVVRDKTNNITTYEDVITGGNNQVYTYEVVAYDYNLNATNKVSLGTVKVRHDGGIPSSTINATSSTVDMIEENNDVHGAVANAGLANMLDGDPTTVYNGRKLTNAEYNSAIHAAELKPNIASYVVLDLNSVKSVIGLKYTAPVTEGVFKTKTLAANALKKYKIDISNDGSSWTTINTGTFNVTADNPTEMVYFAKPGVESGTQLNTYQTRYVRLVSVGNSDIGIAELELVGPPGDNIEIGVSNDNQTYENGIGILSEDYIYQVDNPETTDVNEEQKIPKGSVIITGEYSGNPAFNIPLVLNENEEHIADQYNGILLAKIPSDGKLEEISKGTWIYWVEPEFVDQFMQNKKIFAELYRTDTANLETDGQRLVSNTFFYDIPQTLPSITLSSGKRSTTRVVTELKPEQIQAIVR